MSVILSLNEIEVQLMKMNQWPKKKIPYFRLHLEKITMNSIVRRRIKIMRHTMTWSTDKKCRKKRRIPEILKLQG